PVVDQGRPADRFAYRSLLAWGCFCRCSLSDVLSFLSVRMTKLRINRSRMRRKTTEALIGDVLVNRTSYNQHAKDYQEIDGALGALEMRAVNYQKNEAEVDLIQKLRAAMRNLQRIHKEIGPFRQAEAEGVRSLFRSLIHHELSKKRSAGIG